MPTMTNTEERKAILAIAQEAAKLIEDRVDALDMSDMSKVRTAVSAACEVADTAVVSLVRTCGKTREQRVLDLQSMYASMEKQAMTILNLLHKQEDIDNAATPPNAS
jgi:hypothetical protein